MSRKKEVPVADNNPVFDERAYACLVQVFGIKEGGRYARLLRAFVAGAAHYSWMTFLVPPDLDQALHTVLGVRDNEGRGLELRPIRRLRFLGDQNTGEPAGRLLSDLDHPMAAATRELLREFRIEVDMGVPCPRSVFFFQVLPRPRPA